MPPRCKDLAYFEEFGVRGVEYVQDLKLHLRKILGLDRKPGWR